jgi:alpha-1,6-mannosyltransferase
MTKGSEHTSTRARVFLVFLLCGYLVIQTLGGARRSPLVPPLPTGARSPGWAMAAARVLGLNRLGERGLVALSIAVMLLLVSAFIGVVVEGWRGRLGLRPVLVVAGISLALAVAGPLMLSRDVASYAAYGRMIAVHHSNPYEREPADFPDDPFTPVVSLEWIHTRSVYGPAFTLASAGIAGAWSSSPGAAILAFKALAGLSCAVAVLLCVAACRVVKPERVPLAAAVVGLNPVIVVHTVGGGHNDAMVAALLAGALLLALKARARPALAVTALLVLATLVKAVAAIPLALWIWRIAWPGPPRERLRLLAVHIGAAAAMAVAISAPLFAGWRTATAALNLASRQGWASGARFAARGAEAIGRAIAGHGGASAARSAVYAAFLAAFALVVLKLFSRRGLDGPADAWGTSLLLFALAAPYLLPWYAAWFVPFLALMGDGTLVRIGLIAATLLALTGIPAEPGPDPALWRAMVLIVHYALAPAMLALFVLAAGRAVGWSREPDGVDPAAPR